MKTQRFKVIRPVFSTLSVGEVPDEYAHNRFTSPEQVYHQFRYLANESKEHFISLLLDGKNRIMCIDVVSIGSLNQSIVHPREVFKTAMLSSAAALIILHNHPSLDVTPSREDREITRRLKEAGEILGVKLLDSIIIGDGFFSFSATGLL